MRPARIICNIMTRSKGGREGEKAGQQQGMERVREGEGEKKERRDRVSTRCHVTGAR